MSSRFLMGLAGLLSPQHDSSGPGSSLIVGGLSRAIQQGGGQRLFRFKLGRDQHLDCFPTRETRPRS
jgi:hypothetical protein